MRIYFKPILDQIPKFTMEEVGHLLSLRDYCYPIGSVQPSCIRLPPTNANHFEIKPQIINMLPKFIGIEDAYIFIREFEEACDTMRIHELSKDVIKLRLINFFFKKNTKKWLYSLPTQSIST